MIRKYAPYLLLLCLWGCAPAREFQAAPQDGAQRSSTFPRFSDRPEAETSQFTPQTSQNLIQELRQQGQDLQRQTGVASLSSRRIKKTDEKVQDLHKEVEQTLRHIEQGNRAPTQPE